MAHRLFVVVVFLGWAGITQAQVRIEPQRSGVDVRLRGISAVDDQVAWASGRKGTVLRTRDGGATWENISVPGAEQLDFRDVEGFDAMHAVVLSIGNGVASRVYRTTNGGRNWILVLQNTDQRAFFDCMAFQGERGWMLGDPVGGRYQLYATTDAGRTWVLNDGPQAVADEAAFAASGTCLARSGDALLMGASAGAQLQVRRDDDSTWQSHASGMGRGKAEAGVFSIAPTANGAIAVGGDYKAEQSPGNAALLKFDAKGAALRILPAPRGFRSGVACAGRLETCVVVGPAGADAWNGQDWSPVSDTGYDAIDLIGNAGWASGDKGRIGRVLVESAP